MRIILDTDRQLISDATGVDLPLYSREGFELLSRLWLKVGWNQKYTYTFSWLGRPIIQLPDDLVRAQEVIYRARPDVIIETGVAHGGSLVYYASLCRAMGSGRVIGVDIDIREHNRRAIESHELASLITLVEGSSTDEETIDRVRRELKPSDRVLIFLDSCHTKAHVAAELQQYHQFVSPGSYIVATDGIMQDLHDVPRGTPEWRWDHPSAAAAEFAAAHPEFILEQPEHPFNESQLQDNVTHWPGAWLRRR